MAASELAWSNALDKLAHGIHNRAQAREDLHQSLFPLADARVREQDEEDLQHDPQIAWRVEELQAKQGSAA